MAGLSLQFHLLLQGSPSTPHVLSPCLLADPMELRGCIHDSSQLVYMMSMEPH